MLAHPGQQQNFALIPALVRAGLCGLERNHPANSARDRALIDRIAGEQGLFLTGGSDFHGENKPDIRLGTGRGALNVPDEWYEALREAAEKA